jgi:hypothetical protein
VVDLHPKTPGSMHEGRFSRSVSLSVGSTRGGTNIGRGSYLSLSGQSRRCLGSKATGSTLSAEAIDDSPYLAAAWKVAVTAKNTQLNALDFFCTNSTESEAPSGCDSAIRVDMGSPPRLSSQWLRSRYAATAVP